MESFCSTRNFARIGAVVTLLLALSVSSVQAQTGDYPPCIVTCRDASGRMLEDGRYPLCQNCSAIAFCVNGQISVQACAFGTNFYDRRIDQCVDDDTVCINDTALTTAAPTTPLTTSTTQASTTTTTTTTVATEAPPTTTTMVATEAPTTTTTVATEAPTTTTTVATEAPTTTTMAALTTTATTTESSPSTGYIPTQGDEAATYNYAVDLYNMFSLREMRSSGVSVGDVSTQVVERTANGAVSQILYRFDDVRLVDTVCSNTDTNMGAGMDRCPLASGISWTETCSFTVRYYPLMTVGNKYSMKYMMCK